jgi:hypothetical protein
MSIATAALAGILIGKLVTLYGRRESRLPKRDKHGDSRLPIPRKVSHTSSSESQLLLYCSMIVGFLAMSVMMKIRGSTTTTLITSI